MVSGLLVKPYNDSLRDSKSGPTSDPPEPPHNRITLFIKIIIVLQITSCLKKTTTSSLKAKSIATPLVQTGSGLENP